MGVPRSKNLTVVTTKTDQAITVGSINQRKIDSNKDIDHLMEDPRASMMDQVDLVGDMGDMAADSMKGREDSAVQDTEGTRHSVRND